MSTQPPTPTFPIAESEEDKKVVAELNQVHEELRKNGVQPSSLALFFFDANEMVLGEVYREGELWGQEGERASFDPTEMVALKNPKRYTRMVFVDGSTGKVAIDFRISDFDFVRAGIIEIQPRGGFYFDWLDYVSQLSYCKAYLNFIEKRAVARAAQAGIVPAMPSAIAQLQDLERRRK